MYNLKTCHFNPMKIIIMIITKMSFKNSNPTLDTQSTDLTVVSNALLVPVRHVEEQDIKHNTEQDPQ